MRRLKAVELGADSLGLIFEWIDMDLLKCMRSSGVMTLPLVKARATARAKARPLPHAGPHLPYTCRAFVRVAFALFVAACI